MFSQSLFRSCANDRNYQEGHKPKDFFLKCLILLDEDSEYELRSLNPKNTGESLRGGHFGVSSVRKVRGLYGRVCGQQLENAVTEIVGNDVPLWGNLPGRLPIILRFPINAMKTRNPLWLNHICSVRSLAVMIVGVTCEAHPGFCGWNRFCGLPDSRPHSTRRAFGKVSRYLRALTFKHASFCHFGS
jgi:hypothetical protein